MFSSNRETDWVPHLVRIHPCSAIFGKLIGCQLVLTEPQLNIFLFILDVLTDRMCLLNNSEWSRFRTRRSAGSSALEPAGERA